MILAWMRARISPSEHLIVAGGSAKKSIIMMMIMKMMMMMARATPLKLCSRLLPAASQPAKFLAQPSSSSSSSIPRAASEFHRGLRAPKPPKPAKLLVGNPIIPQLVGFVRRLQFGSKRSLASLVSKWIHTRSLPASAQATACCDRREQTKLSREPLLAARARWRKPLFV